MKKEIVSILFIILLLAPLLSAGTLTKVTVKTEPSKQVFINFLNDYGVNKGRLFDPELSAFVITSNSNGLATASYSPTVNPIQVSVRIDGMGTFQYFEHLTIGKEIYIDMTATPPSVELRELTGSTTPTTSTPTANSTNTSTTNQTTQNTTRTTNSSIQNTTPTSTTPATTTQTTPTSENKENIFSKIWNSIKTWIMTLVYIVLVIILLVVIIMVAIKFKKRIPKAPAPVKTVKYSEKFASSKELKSAEEKLRQAQDEINKLKSREREIQDSENKIRQEQERLRRLRGF